MSHDNPEPDPPPPRIDLGPITERRALVAMLAHARLAVFVLVGVTIAELVVVLVLIALIVNG